MKTLIASIIASFSFVASASPVQQHKMPSNGSNYQEQMHQSMSEMCMVMEHMHMTGDVNRDFAAMMIPHHQGAIEMARAYLKEGTDPHLLRMAEEMIQEQEREIQELQDWLIQH